jgi:hypothetical protein|tara:strand:- start:1204 stop:1410 length:207 start_codon:yes stop_codon:yes gene_type:complete
MAKKIKIMHNSSTFADMETESDNVGALRSELSLSSGDTVNVNGTVASDNTSLEEDAFVAVVSNNKTGG